jgi:hypothetical protein
MGCAATTTTTVAPTSIGIGTSCTLFVVEIVCCGGGGASTTTSSTPGIKICVGEKK